jgi:hypothetical protein
MPSSSRPWVGVPGTAVEGQFSWPSEKSSGILNPRPSRASLPWEIRCLPRVQPSPRLYLHLSLQTALLGTNARSEVPDRKIVDMAPRRQHRTSQSQAASTLYTLSGSLWASIRDGWTSRCVGEVKLATAVTKCVRSSSPEPRASAYVAVVRRVHARPVSCSRWRSVRLSWALAVMYEPYRFCPRSIAAVARS